MPRSYRLTTDRWMLAGGAGMCAAAVWFSVLSILRHRALQSSAFDLGIFLQVIYSSAHGHPFAYDFRTMSYLGDHFQITILLFAPLIAVWPYAETLLIAQAVLLASASLPLLWITRRLTGSRTLALVVGMSYLVNPYLHRAVIFDFHPDALAPLLVFAATLALLQQRPVLASAGLAGLLLTKEDFVLTAIALSWLAAVRLGQPRLAGVWAAGSLVYGMIIMGLVQPAIRGEQPTALADRYAYLGHDLPSIVAGAVRHPQLVLTHLVTPAHLATVLLFSASVGLLLALDPVTALGVVPPLAAHLLSAWPPQAELDAHYSLSVLPVAYVALAIGLRRAGALPPRRWRTATAVAVLLVPSTILFWRLSPLPPAAHVDRTWLHPPPASGDLRKVEASIPAGAPVTASDHLVPQVAAREDVYVLPHIRNAAYVVLDMAEPDANGAQPACLRELLAAGFTPRVQEGEILLLGRSSTTPVAPAPACGSGAPADQTISR